MFISKYSFNTSLATSMAFFGIFVMNVFPLSIRKHFVAMRPRSADDTCDHSVDVTIHICYLPAGRSVLGKTVPEVLSTARGRRPRAVPKTEGTVFPNTDGPRPAYNVFIIFFRRVLCKQFLC